MPRSDKIAQILARRHAHADALESLGTQIEAALNAVDGLDAGCDNLAPHVEDGLSGQLLAIRTDLQSLRIDLTAGQDNTRRLIARLRRPTLNIGMVGRARMGKSRFLQSLTGLTTREIPDGRAGFCTGVPSLIRHTDGGQTRADVFLHDNQSFVSEVLRPYYVELNLGTPPPSARGFAHHPLPPAPDQSPHAVTVHGHLAAYHRNFSRYGPLLEQGSPLLVGADQIRQFVAQDDLDGAERHDFRAVRRVHIFTSFPMNDLAGIGVIDLPGLGDTNLGDAQTLRNALRDDVDLVLFVREPNARGDGITDFDVALYGTAETALPDIPMQRRSFLVINHRRSVDSDNLTNAEAYREKVLDSVIKVVDASIVDCSAPDEVAAAFNPVIDHLLANLDELDGYLLAESRRQVAELSERANQLADRANGVSRFAQPSAEWFRQFQLLFTETFGRLSSGLENLVKHLQQDRDSPDERFAAAVADVIGLAEADHGVPTAAEIAQRIDTDGGLPQAYGNYLNELRSHLSRHFLNLDDVLAARVIEMQRAVAAVLRDAGGLAPLCPDDDRRFLLALTERTKPKFETGGESEIAYGLRLVADFHLSYRGFIQHRIRPCLDGLHPGRPAYPLGDRPESISDAELRDILLVSYQEALYRCESALQGILAEPNGALFAIVEEFRDRVLRSAYAGLDWQALYEEVRTEIWSGQFAVLAERSSQLGRWNSDVDALRAAISDKGWALPGAPEGAAA